MPDNVQELVLVREDFPTTPEAVKDLPISAREARLNRDPDAPCATAPHMARVDEAIFVMSSGKYHSGSVAEYAEKWGLKYQSAGEIFKEAARFTHRFDDIEWVKNEKSATIAELKQIARLATEGKQYAAAVAALREVGDVAGTKVTRIEVTHVKKAPPGLSQEVWESNSEEAKRQVQRHVLLQILKDVPNWPHEEKQMVLCDLRGAIVRAEADEYVVEVERQGS